MPKAKPRKSATVLSIEPSPLRGAQMYGITDSAIARRAFEIFCERGSAHGHDVEDWLQAERELRGAVTAAVA